MAKFTLARLETYLAYAKSGILHMPTLSPDSSLKNAEEDIAQNENKGHSSSSSHKKGHFHPFERPEKSCDSSKSDQPAWETIDSRGHGKKHEGKSSNYST